MSDYLKKTWADQRG